MKASATGKRALPLGATAGWQVLRGVQSGHTVDNVVLEVNSLKFAQVGGLSLT